MKENIILTVPNGTISEIVLETHEKGLWFETSMDSYTVLTEAEVKELVDKLKKFL